MIIGLFGLSGSGKSTINKKIQEKYPSFYCTSASKILSEFNRPTLKKDLFIRNLDENQEVLISKLKFISMIHENICIELHTIIEDKSNNFYFVSEQNLLSLQLDYVFILDIVPAKILENRLLDRNKERAFISLEDLEKLSELQYNYLKSIFDKKLKCIKSLEDIQYFLDNSINLNSK